MMKTDIKETEKAFELDIDLPGFKKENVHAELQDGYLTVSANTETETEDKDVRIFARSASLAAAAAASMLVMTFPKTTFPRNSKTAS